MQELTQAVRHYRGLVQALALASTVSVGFYLVGTLFAHSGAYWYLVWNLFLAWLPLLFAAWLVAILPARSWDSWLAIALTLLWLGFLPNSFYIITDFIHLAADTGNLLYQAAMIMSFALNGLALGFVSLYILHRQLLKRLANYQAAVVVALVLVLTSFAIYLGRDLRWNSWDALTNPAGILFDISDVLLHPFGHLQAFTTTLTFFSLLGGIYATGWQLLRAFRPSAETPK